MVKPSDRILISWRRVHLGAFISAQPANKHHVLCNSDVCEMCTQKNGLYLLTDVDDLLQHFHLLQLLTVTHSHCR